jgi:hypothetical protein
MYCNKVWEAQNDKCVERICEMSRKIDHNQKETQKHVIGKWIWEGRKRDKNIQLEVIIKKNSVTIQHGKEMVFKIRKPVSVVPFWFGDYLVFLPTLYFVRYADADVMLFGELKRKYREVIWEREFFRIKSAS